MKTGQAAPSPSPPGEPRTGRRARSRRTACARGSGQGAWLRLREQCSPGAGLGQGTARHERTAGRREARRSGVSLVRRAWAGDKVSRLEKAGGYVGPCGIRLPRPSFKHHYPPERGLSIQQQDHVGRQPAPPRCLTSKSFVLSCDPYTLHRSYSFLCSEQTCSLKSDVRLAFSFLSFPFALDWSPEEAA